MHKLNSGVRRIPAAAKAGFKGNWNGKHRNRPGYWFGVLKRAVREDCEERGEPPDLAVADVLAWADAFLARTGDWPAHDSGPIPEAPGETWLLVAAALALGLRGFPCGGSIPRFLDEHRGRYNPKDQKFTVDQVLAWADAWYARTGDWPYGLSGDIPGSGGINWNMVDAAFRFGRGMLPSGTSLGRFLADRRGVVRHPPFTEEQILAWADAHHRRTGKWPIAESGPVTDEPDETWNAVNSALSAGTRGLPGGSSLAQLLVARRQAKRHFYSPRLTIPQVLAWADAFHARTGRWPTCTSGPVLEAPGELWASVHSAVFAGHRGLPGGSTISELLFEHRGIRTIGYAPPLLISQILAWADAFHARDGGWPVASSGPVAESHGETWCAIDAALRLGSRELPCKSSLSRLLAEERGVQHGKDPRPISIPDILRWADAYNECHGTWPDQTSGPIREAPGESWRIIQRDLAAGRRGLPAKSSIARLLAEHRGSRYKHELADLTVPQILAWSDAFHARTGRWPTERSGALPESRGETWATVNYALKKGNRGLRGGSTLAELLVRERGMRCPYYAVRPTIPRILAWADAYHARTGRWPNCSSGPIAEEPGENWMSVASALQHGYRGLPSGSSLARLLIEHRGIRSCRYLPPLLIPQILAWADAFRARADRWPTALSGPVVEAPGETWSAIEAALSEGFRGLPGGSSLSRLLAQERSTHFARDIRVITVPEILRWADAYKQRHGKWPNHTSGPIPEAPGENWNIIRTDLSTGRRGLPANSSIARLLAEHRGRRHPGHLADLTIPQILAWTDAFHARTGRWPDVRSGPVAESPGDTWAGICYALTKGTRGLPGGLSLARLLVQERRGQS